jgi:hypothetical protein
MPNEGFGVKLGGTAFSSGTGAAAGMDQSQFLNLKWYYLIWMKFELTYD